MESAGLAMLIPILGLVSNTGHDTSWWRRDLDHVFAAVGATSPFAQLALLIGIFGVVMVARGVVTTARDVRMAELQIGFLQHQRAQLVEALAAAPWPKLAALEARPHYHLMSGDLARVSTGVYFLLQGSVALCLLAGYFVLSALLAPVLAAIALILLAAIGMGLRRR